MKIDIALEGQPTAEKIRAFPDVLKRYMLQAFVTSASLVAQDAAARAPKRTGNLAADMEIQVKERGDTYTVTVGPKAFYAGWVEYGHRVGKRGTRVQARLARYLEGSGGPAPGAAMVPPHPYFMPAVVAQRAAYSTLISDAISRAEAETEAGR